MIDAERLLAEDTGREITVHQVACLWHCVDYAEHPHKYTKPQPVTIEAARQVLDALSNDSTAPPVLRDVTKSRAGGANL